MISISHAPNTTRRQQRLAWRLLMPWKWPHLRHGHAAASLETWFKQHAGSADAIAFSTGREALTAVLQSLGIGYGDEVIVQAYTCIVVPHAVIWSGAHPIYADIDQSLNIDPALLQRLLTNKTKAIIVQHTFGVPANLEAIRKICDEHQLFLIEDCAHGLGAMYKSRVVGSWGDAAIYSFGRDKVVSGVSGGMAVARSEAVCNRLRGFQKDAPLRSRRWVIQNLLHPLLIPLFLRLMGRGKIGMAALRASQYFGILNKVYTRQELDSQPPAALFHSMPQAMASLAHDQLEQEFTAFGDHRARLASRYSAWAEARGLPHQNVPQQAQPSWLRFTLLVPRPFRIITLARAAGFVLGDWYASVIMPRPRDEQALFYQPGSCPKAESAARQSLNLPTHIHMTDADAEKLMKWLEQQI